MVCELKNKSKHCDNDCHNNIQQSQIAEFFIPDIFLEIGKHDLSVRFKNIENYRMRNINFNKFCMRDPNK